MRRRRFLLYMPLLCCPRVGLAASDEPTQGCALVRTLGSLSEHTARSGDHALDSALIAEVKKLDQTFQINPGYRFLRDGNRPNAYASTETYVQGTSGTI